MADARRRGSARPRPRNPEAPGPGGGVACALMSAVRIGVCSWSLQPESPSALALAIRECGLDATQLALDPIRRGEWTLGATRDALRRERIAILSGMMAPTGEDYSTLESIRRTGGLAPDETWAANLTAAKENAAIARELGLGLVTVHGGAIPEDETGPRCAALLGRLARIAGVFGERRVRLALETGQDPPATLARALETLEAQGTPIGVNFDPANVILYGVGNPAAALRTLAARVVQAHVKDARPAKQAGEWGEEVVAGTGAVGWASFALLVRRLAPGAALVIEREGGDRRIEDVRAAASVVREALGGERAGVEPS